jgi:hypothetical protein
MKVYLTKDNLFNHGDTATLTNFLHQRAANKTKNGGFNQQ